MNDNVVEFPGLAYGKIDPAVMAEHLVATASELESMVVLGVSKDGKFYFATSEGDAKETFWILKMADIHFSQQVLDPEE